MRCKTIQRWLPDYRLADLSAKRRKMVKDHLAVCDACRLQAQLWESLCEFSADVCRLPAEFDWTPFERALEAELRRSHTPAGTFSRWKERLLDNLNAAFNYPRKNALRVVFVLTLAVIAVLALVSPRPPAGSKPSLGNLTIGDTYLSVQDDGIVYYLGFDREQTFARREATINTSEGIEPEGY